VPASGEAAEPARNDVVASRPATAAMAIVFNSAAIFMRGFLQREVTPAKIEL
jgi:hypothetical protein